MKTTILWGIALLTILYIPLKAQRLPISTPTEAEATPDPTTSWEAREAKWTEFAQIDGRFSVRTPGPLQMKADTVETALGEMVYHTYFFQPQEDLRENEVYMLSYVDYPEGSLHHDSTELVQELLAETLAAATESVDGEVLFQREGKQQDFPYQYWRIDYLGGRASIRTKAIVARNRFYTIQTVSRREWGINNSTDRFIDSFRVF